MKGATKSLTRDLRRAAVSIHAPVKGATPDGWRQSSIEVVSIHAPVKGATSVKGGGLVVVEFQFTLP